MSISVPDSVDDVETGDYVLGEAITFGDWQDLTDRLHWMYARKAGHASGAHAWAPPFRRASTTLGTEPDNFVRPLDHAHFPVQPIRPAVGADNWPLTVVAHVTTAKIEFELIGTLGGQPSAIASATTTVSGTAWAVASFNPTDFDVDASGRQRPLEVRMKLAAATSEQPGYLRQASIFEAILSRSDMPTG